MRAIRALVGLALIVALWLLWRAPAFVADLDRYSAAAHVAQARIARAEGQVAVALDELRIALEEEPGNRTARALLRLLRAARTPPLRFEAPGVPVSFAALPDPLPYHKVAVATLRSKPQLSPSPVAPQPNPDAVIAAAAITPPVTPPPQVPEPTTAETGYAALVAGDRRAAATAFRRALAQSPGDPRAAQWRRQLAFLEKRWSANVYALLRENGVSELVATPVLGGGQSGAQIAFALDPLAPRPLSLEARISVPSKRLVPNTQAAIGLSWQATPHLALTAERLVRIGSASRDAWTFRAAAGAERRSATLALDAYAEAGVVGLRDRATYAAAQGHVARRVTLHGLDLAIGAGGWASAQHDVRTVSRFELGPSLRLRHGALDLSADYRLRLAGNAAPGSGPAVTLAAYF